ncbi:hypothetical protein [Salinibius halmophilus]|uniref:hypothetical protein n=1 Tax=Salinibius halmophilus TaxID=1853216 RepID=UPI001314048E|nr:hypothetical protein [Salinibius halmophilus]
MTRTVTITHRQAQLVLKHGYFDDKSEKSAVEAIPKGRGYYEVELSEFTCENFIADLVHYAKRLRSERSLDEIDRLCDELEGFKRSVFIE